MKTVLLIDGGYLRASAQAVNKSYTVAFIETFSRLCFDSTEYIFRIIYYDSPQYKGRVQLPVSGLWHQFNPTDTLLDDLAKSERFACRYGSLGFRGWKPRSIPLSGGVPLSDSDFKPVFEQKGVDMRIGLDVASFATRQSVDRIILTSGDTDMIPAMKQARKSGLEVGMVQLPAPAKRLHDNLQRHSDFIRNVNLP
jgi:uncharacterized LabA/DUF88 family protein